MVLASKNNLSKEDLQNFFKLVENNPIPLPVELQGPHQRIWVFSANSKKEEVATYSWLKLDLTKYCGFKKDGDKIKVFFHCNIYKNIYFLENHFYYIYSSAILQGNIKILTILKEYIKERERIMNNDKLELFGIEPIAGQVKAIFYINNLTSKDFAMALNYQELQDQLSSNMLEPDRRELYAKALNSIEEYNLKLPNIQDYFDSYMLEVA